SGGAVCQASCSSENSISVEVDDQAQHALRAVVGTEVDRKDVPLEAPLLVAGDRHSGGWELLDPAVSQLSHLRRRGLPGFVLLGELDRLASYGEVAAQRMADPVFGHEDPGQPGMAVEEDPEHVERLSLVPVGGPEDVVHAGYPSVRLRHVDADPELVERLHVSQLVDQLEALWRRLDQRRRQVVDAGHEDVAEVALILQVRQGLPDRLTRHGYPLVAHALAL